MTFDALTYFRTMATKLNDIGHTEENEHFFRVRNLYDMNELLDRLSNANFPALLINDSMDGSMGDFAMSDNYLDEPQFVFYVLAEADITNQASIDQAVQTAKTIGQKIISMMLRHKMQGKHGLEFLDMTNIPYQTIGPIGDFCYGMMFFVNVSEHIELIVNPEDWDGSW